MRLLHNYLPGLTNEQLIEVSTDVLDVAKNPEVELHMTTRCVFYALIKSIQREIFMRICPTEPEKMRRLWRKIERERAEPDKSVQ